MIGKSSCSLAEDCKRLCEYKEKSTALRGIINSKSEKKIRKWNKDFTIYK